MVYHALGKSKLQYGTVLWENAKKDMEQLQKIYNKAIHCITGMPYKSRINNLYHKTGILKICDLYCRL